MPQTPAPLSPLQPPTWQSRAEERKTWVRPEASASVPGALLAAGDTVGRTGSGRPWCCVHGAQALPSTAQGRQASLGRNLGPGLGDLRALERLPLFPPWESPGRQDTKDTPASPRNSSGVYRAQPHAVKLLPPRLRLQKYLLPHKVEMAEVRARLRRGRQANTFRRAPRAPGPAPRHVTAKVSSRRRELAQQRVPAARPVDSQLERGRRLLHMGEGPARCGRLFPALNWPGERPGQDPSLGRGRTWTVGTGEN